MYWPPTCRWAASGVPPRSAGRRIRRSSGSWSGTTLVARRRSAGTAATTPTRFERWSLSGCARRTGRSRQAAVVLCRRRIHLQLLIRGRLVSGQVDDLLTPVKTAGRPITNQPREMVPRMGSATPRRKTLRHIRLLAPVLVAALISVGLVAGAGPASASGGVNIVIGNWHCR